MVAFRDIAGAKNRRTATFTVIRGTAVSNNAPLINTNLNSWKQRACNSRNFLCQKTPISSNLASVGGGNGATENGSTYATSAPAALLTANMNSVPLDWATRCAVGGNHMSFFIVKQLPVLPPSAYFESFVNGLTWECLIIPRVLELIYTSYELTDFANDLGYNGAPFVWNDERRHCLQSELDAIFAHIYGLNKRDLEWMLDGKEPSMSFSILKNNEIIEFGEYRTKRYILEAYDQLSTGDEPDLSTTK